MKKNNNLAGYISLILIIFVAIFLFFPYKPGHFKYNDEIQNLVFAYPIYVSTLCPNKSGLEEIKINYLKTISEKDVSHRKWVHENFESKFMSLCLEHERKRVIK